MTRFGEHRPGGPDWRAILARWIAIEEQRMALLRDLLASLCETEPIEAEPPAPESPPAAAVEETLPTPVAPTPSEEAPPSVEASPSEAAPLEVATPTVESADTHLDSTHADLEIADAAIEAAIEAAAAEIESPAPLVESVQVQATIREAAMPPRADTHLLLLTDGDNWVGFPWAYVGEVCLSEEHEGPAPISLRGLLASKLPPGSNEDEGFVIHWQHAERSGALACAGIGGIVPAGEAPGRGVGRVLRPLGSGDFDLGWMSLVEYLADARAGASAEAAPSANEAAGAPEQGVEPENESDGATENVIVQVPEGKNGDQLSVSGESGVSTRSRLRSLVAVRYLPLKVAVERTLQASSIDWDEIDPDDLAGALLAGPFDLVLIEPPPEPDERLLAALRRARETGVSVISVGSRLRGAGPDPLAPLGPLPRLAHPFAEGEFEQLLATLGVGIGA